jgi:hypothetical protein
MTAKPASVRRGKAPPALKALRRAAKNAVELARRTGTAAYVMENGRIIDAAKPIRKNRRIGSR